MEDQIKPAHGRTCQKCGATAHDGLIFCVHCGSPLRSPTSLIAESTVDVRKTESVEHVSKGRLDRLTAKWGVFAFACSSPLLLFFYHRGEPGKGMVASAFAMVTLIVAGLFWDLRKSVWFWVSAIGTVAIHVPIVIFIPWPDSNHARGLLAIGLPDLFLVYGCFKMVEKTTTKRTRPENEAVRTSQTSADRAI